MSKKIVDPQEVMKRLKTAQAQGAGQANVPQVNPDDCPDMLCMNCEGTTFIQTFSFKALSVFEAPPKGGQFQLIIMQCIQCGTPLNLEESRGMAFKRDREEKKVQENKRPIAKREGKDDKKDTNSGPQEKNNKIKVDKS